MTNPTPDDGPEPDGSGDVFDVGPQSSPFTMGSHRSGLAGLCWRCGATAETIGEFPVLCDNAEILLAHVGLCRGCADWLLGLGDIPAQASPDWTVWLERVKGGIAAGGKLPSVEPAVTDNPFAYWWSAGDDE